MEMYILFWYKQFQMKMTVIIQLHVSITDCKKRTCCLVANGHLPIKDQVTQKLSAIGHRTVCFLFYSFKLVLERVLLGKRATNCYIKDN